MSEPSGNSPDHQSGTPYLPDPAGWPWLRFILDHNPCFLLSALFMFLGVFLLNSARDVNAADLPRLLGVLAAVNAYEFALIALALLLFRRTATPAHRDATLLLIIQSLFLTDAGFLLNESVQTAPTWGWTVNVVLFLLAVAKSALVFAGLKIKPSLRVHGFLALQLAILYGLPILLSRLAKDGEVSSEALYVAWWIVGLLPALYDLVAGQRPLQALDPRQQILRRAYVVIPWLLLVAHLGFFHYVYRAQFFLGDLSPVLLGLAVITRRIPPTAFYPAVHLRIFRIVLPIVALLIALGTPDNFHLVMFAGKNISPFLLTAAAMMVTFGYFHSLRAAGLALTAVVLMAIGHALSARIILIMKAGLRLLEAAVDFLFKLLPTTPTGWGIVAIVAAFLTLALGALTTLHRTRRSEVTL